MAGKLIYRAHNDPIQKVRVWREEWPGDTFEVWDLAKFQSFLVNRDQTTVLGSWSEASQAEDCDINIPNVSTDGHSLVS